MAAELTGILQALLWTDERRDRLPMTGLRLRSDSLETLRHAAGRRMGQEHLAPQGRIHAQVGKLSGLGIRVEMQHVTGHSEEPGNEAADWIAG